MTPERVVSQLDVDLNSLEEREATVSYVWKTKQEKTKKTSIKALIFFVSVIFGMPNNVHFIVIERQQNGNGVKIFSPGLMNKGTFNYKKN